MSDYSKKFAKRLKPFLDDKVFSVSEFIDFVNGLLKPLKICKVIVKGEIGEDIYINDQKGWAIFNLIDEEGSRLGCFALSYVVDKLGVDLEPGLEVKITGHPEVRKNKGRFSFQVSRISLVGEGDLKKQFEILKKKLKEEGFFDDDKKQEIPQFPKNIGLITSKGSDAEKDFMTHLEDYGFHVSTFPSRVEGEAAIDDILKGIKTLNQDYPELEAIVITRGGGSWESLQAFNSEEVVKAAFSSKIPIISGIGHENDLSLLDLVADQRVSTPTDAGKFLSKSWKDGEKRIIESERNLSTATRRMIKQAERRFEEHANFFERKINQNFALKEKGLDYLFSSLTDKIKNKIDKFYALEKEVKAHGYKIKTKLKNNNQKVGDLNKNLQTNKKRWEKAIKNKLSEKEEKLNLSSPDLKLRQGYSITKLEGKVIKSAKDLSVGDMLETTFKDGEAKSRVEKNE
ncbi:MAG: exodeoxyribonuclease VII large subunit [Patescibacteria group bacterium]